MIPPSDTRGETEDEGDSDIEELVHPLSVLANQMNRIPLENMGPVNYPVDPVIESLINTMLDRMAQNYKERQGWLASISHNLRSPITAIIANAELAMVQEASIDDMSHAVDVAHRNALRLAELIDQFMDDAGKLNVHGLPPSLPMLHEMDSLDQV